MFKLNLSTRIAVATSLFFSLFLIFSWFIYTIGFYWLTEQNIRSYLVEQTNDLVNQQIVFSNDQIKYLYGPQGETIASRLRSLDLSAAIYDKDLKIQSTYGILHNLSDNNQLENILTKQLLENVFQTGIPKFIQISFNSKLDYDIYINPLLVQDKTAGLIVVAKQTQTIKNLVKLGSSLAAVLLPICISTIWILTYFLIKRSLIPLTKVTTHLKTTTNHHHLQHINKTNHLPNEISTLIDSYNEMVDRLNSSFSLQRDFVSHASHELRTPLTKAITTLDLIAAQRIGVSTKKYITQAREDLFTLNQLLDDLLQISSSANSSDQANIKPANLKGLVLDQVSKFEKDLTNNKVLLTVDIPLHTLINVHTSVFSIIMSNLITNAIKFNKPNGTIEISSTENDDSTILSIIDSGIGMTKQETEKIFDKFYRSPKSSTTPGFGLGMSLVKQLCELYDIGIAVDSTPNIGTTISLTFPRPKSLNSSI